MTAPSRNAWLARGPAAALALALALMPAAGRCAQAGPHDAAPTTAVTAATATAPPAPTRSGLDVYARFREGLADPDCPVDSASERWRRHYAHAPERLGARDDDALALFGYVVDALREASLPTEYALIPFVESGYKPGARSASGPAGLWQLAHVTARAHGVPMRAGYDGRLSPVDSTRAAVRYLKTLHGMFAGDWRLAVMAYNAGEYRVFGALRRAHQAARDADPEKLASLSGITRAYVRKLHALSCLLDRADEREAWLQSLDRPIPVLEAVELPAGARDLGRWASADGRDAAMVRRLNPAFAGGRVGRSQGALRVLAPVRVPPAPAVEPDAALAAAGPEPADTLPDVAAQAPPAADFPAAASGPAPATQAH
ncbi:MAG: lytic transglycosylase domain-containing protein [Luteimonas sp.]